MKAIWRGGAILIVLMMLAAMMMTGCAGSAAAEPAAEEPTAEEEPALEEPAAEDAQSAPNMQSPGLDSDGNETGQPEDVYTFEDAPVEMISEGVSEFELPSGGTHWYEVFYLPEGGVNWIQAKNLAAQAGGYLVSMHSDEENAFVFSLIEDEKFWYVWEETGVCNGPFIGAFQPDDSEEPDGGWQWISGEDWTYTNWATDNMDGDEDERDNTQPNDATGNQNVGAFGEITIPVGTWGDFPQKVSSYNDENDARVYGFIIEYEEEPAA